MKYRLYLFAVLVAATLNAAAAQGGPPIRIGVLNDQSGVFADLAGPGSVTAAQMAAEDFGGQVLGRKVEILVADHQSKPDVGASIAQRWFDEERSPRHRRRAGLLCRLGGPADREGEEADRTLGSSSQRIMRSGTPWKLMPQL